MTHARNRFAAAPSSDAPERGLEARAGQAKSSETNAEKRMETRRAPVVRPWNARTWFLLPAFVLLLLILLPPHALDRALIAPFYENGWPLGASTLFTDVFHKGLKVVPIAAALLAVGLLVAGRFSKLSPDSTVGAREVRARLLYAAGAMASCVLLVWWLKATTGVVCPWEVDLFGGAKPVADPTFSLELRPGRCWPGGHAGTGFCLFALYFALRDLAVRKARAAFGFALFLGIFCGTIRMMQGAHFFSHNVATMLIDWLVCAGLYVVLFDRSKILERLRDALKAPVAERTAILFTAAWWTLVFDAPLVKSLLEQAPEGRLLFTGAVLLSFFAIGTALLSIAAIVPRMLARGAMAVLALLGAASFAGGLLYGTVFTPDMVRNFLATDLREAGNYLSVRAVLVFLAAFLPPFFAALRFEKKRAVKIPKSGKAGYDLRAVRAFLLRHPAAARVLGATGAAAFGLALILANFQTFAGVMREDKTLRYRIAPVNVVYSTVRTLAVDASPDANRERIVTDAAPKLARTTKIPVLLVYFVGETTRAANWQLSGYDRETTPRLAAREDLVSFPSVAACGTSTDVSLPCMMSRIGRSDYDRDRILSEEALPDVLQRAGANVLWIDNQSGCKGVCAGVPTRTPEKNEADCPDGVCQDSVLVTELKKLLGNLDPSRPTVLFLHMYGQHGPAYYKGSQKARKVFGPECTSPDLASCSKAEITNAYDNSVRETEAVIADAIALLDDAAAQGKAAPALLWVSDHGESLGENGLFLHGAPYFISPREQVDVPMVMWLSSAFERASGITREALRARAAGSSVTHEHLYSTVLSLVGVESRTYRKDWDLTAAGLSMTADWGRAAGARGA